jgi:hypothetical protein
VSDVRCEFGDEGELSVLAGRPSSKNLKCLTALKAASSSLSKVEYLVPAPDSFLE